MKLSIIIPGIRTPNWINVYGSIFTDSLPQHLTEGIEMVFVGPHDLPSELQGKHNIKHIKSKANPTVCSQIGAIEASGQYISFGTDDGQIVDGSQDQVWNILEAQDYTTVVLGRYTEGPPGKKRFNWNFQMADQYYDIYGYPAHPAPTASVHIPRSYKIANFAYIDRSHFKEMGGFDCRFETTALATADWAVRAQRTGAKFILTDFQVWAVGHEPGKEGVHGAVHDAFMENDLPLYRSIYDDPNCVNRTKIDFDNWKSASDIWQRRFSS